MRRCEETPVPPVTFFCTEQNAKTLSETSEETPVAIAPWRRAVHSAAAACQVAAAFLIMISATS